MHKLKITEAAYAMVLLSSMGAGKHLSPENTVRTPDGMVQIEVDDEVLAALEQINPDPSTAIMIAVTVLKNSK